ncbi:MAG TPA: protein translocase subunit SecD [Gammaproteobacteria bacterium]
MNQYPLWKNLLVLGVLLVSLVLALPTFFGDDPAVQVTRSDGTPMDQQALEQVRTTLTDAGITFTEAELDDDAVVVRFASVSEQLRANEVLGDALPNHVSALTLAPRTPDWMAAIGLRPMALGLDLRGGVHFLYQVDLDAAIDQYLSTLEADLRNELREADIRGVPRVDGDSIVVQLADGADLAAAEQVVRRLDDPSQLTSRFVIDRTQVDGRPGLRVRLTEAALRERQDFAIQQNTTTLRNRVNELGVSEAVVQRQGLNRILVELPGVQDPAQAKRVLGSTATLEFHLVDTEADPFEAERRGRAPLGSELHHHRDGTPIVLRREVIVSGDQLIDAIPTYQQGQPVVSIRLDAAGGRRMLDATSQNVGRPMAIVYIEETPQLVERNGEEVIETVREERVISAPVIQGVFSTNFVVEGLTPFEAQDLALLLRAGSLAAPLVTVEERTIGPTLGQDNIAVGRRAVIVSFFLVVAFMALYYRVFGLIADLALFANLVMLIAIMSLLPTALTLPGIAGIVLTVGMAVDANVLIFERIREELRAGNSPQASIRAGYDKAFLTILDSNLTTVFAAVVLFLFGTGPVKGFAVTLTLGLATSMFTAIMGTRAVVNLLYGGRQQVASLPIGGRVSDAVA